MWAFLLRNCVARHRSVLPGLVGPVGGTPIEGQVVDYVCCFSANVDPWLSREYDPDT